MKRIIEDYKQELEKVKEYLDNQGIEFPKFEKAYQEFQKQQDEGEAEISESSYKVLDEAIHFAQTRIWRDEQVQNWKEEIDKDANFSNPRIAKNYPSISFNYRGIGRFQLRYIEDIFNDYIELHAFSYLFKSETLIGTFNVVDNFERIKEELDLIIANNEKLYEMAEPVK